METEEMARDGTHRRIIWAQRWHMADRVTPVEWPVEIEEGIEKVLVEIDAIEFLMGGETMSYPVCRYLCKLFGDGTLRHYAKGAKTGSLLLFPSVGKRGMSCVRLFTITSLTSNGRAHLNAQHAEGPISTKFARVAETLR
jgi:hypothetical protein